MKEVRPLANLSRKRHKNQHCAKNGLRGAKSQPVFLFIKRRLKMTFKDYKEMHNAVENVEDQIEKINEIIHENIDLQNQDYIEEEKRVSKTKAKQMFFDNNKDAILTIQKIENQLQALKEYFENIKYTDVQ